MKAEEHPLSQKPLIEIPKGPYRYDPEYQQVFAPAMRPLMDKDHEYLLAEIRGHGHLQYLENGNALQDAFGFAVARLPELLKAEQERDSLNEQLERGANQYMYATLKISELEETITKKDAKLEAILKGLVEIKDYVKNDEIVLKEYVIQSITDLLNTANKP